MRTSAMFCRSEAIICDVCDARSIIESPVRGSGQHSSTAAGSRWHSSKQRSAASTAAGAVKWWDVSDTRCRVHARRGNSGRDRRDNA